MENSTKILLIGFYAILFASSISMIIYMSAGLEELYNYADNHIAVKSVLEESLIE
jgi:hypothetical protein